MATTEVDDQIDEEFGEIEYTLGQIGVSLDAFRDSETSANHIDLAALQVLRQLLNQALNLADALS